MAITLFLAILTLQSVQVHAHPSANSSSNSSASSLAVSADVAASTADPHQILTTAAAPVKKAAVVAQVVSKSTTSSRPPKNHTPSKGTLKQLDDELRLVEDEERDKEKEINVQATLVAEKETGMKTSETKAAELKKAADRLSKEAEVAAEITKEKSEAAAREKKAQVVAEAEAQKIQAESQETQKFLLQTQSESTVLLAKESEIRAKIKAEALRQKKLAEERAKKARQEATAGSPSKPAAQPSNLKSSYVAAVGKPAVFHSISSVSGQPLREMSPGNKTSSKSSDVGLATAATARATKAPDAEPTSEEVRKLLAENARLKKEKAELAEQLMVRTEEQERSKLKHKLKNKLEAADRAQALIHKTSWKAGHEEGESLKKPQAHQRDAATRVNVTAT